MNRPFNHCGKCAYLKRHKPLTIVDKKGNRVGECAGGFCQSLGAYYCEESGKWWCGERPTYDTCEKYKHR